jgi:hypothetical protein
VTAGRTPDDLALQRGFVKGLVVAACAVLVLAGLIAIANHGHHRPEGVAEHWLEAVSDTTRKGVQSDARKRVEKTGSIDQARPLLPAVNPSGRKSAFTDLEVGKAVKLSATRVGVPFLLHQRTDHGASPTRTGTIILDRAPATTAEWRVSGVTLGERIGKVPSQGGPPPSRAPAGLWVAALLAGLGVTALCTLLLRLAGGTGTAGPAAVT